MLKASFGYQGGITAPQKTAALAGYDVLKDGGTAIEAMVAAAAMAATPPEAVVAAMCGDSIWH